MQSNLRAQVVRIPTRRLYWLKSNTIYEVPASQKIESVAGTTRQTDRHIKHKLNSKTYKFFLKLIKISPKTPKKKKMRLNLTPPEVTVAARPLFANDSK